jgi:hypothetical protein
VVTTAYTASLRLTQPGVGDVATQNAWGALLNTDMALIEAAITGKSQIDTAGASTLTLTTANGATDQARPFCLYFIDSSGGNTPCVVTVPAVVRFGLVINTCKHYVYLTTTGSAPYLSIQPGTAPFLYYCDGTNLSSFVNPGFVNRSASYSGTFTMPAPLVRFKLWGGGGGSPDVHALTGGIGGGGGGGAYCEFAYYGSTSTSVTCSIGTSGSGASGGSTILTIPSASITATAGGGAVGGSSSGSGGGGSAIGGAGGTATLSGVSGILSNGLQGGTGFSGSIGGTIFSLGGTGGCNTYGGAPGGPALSINGFGGASTGQGGVAAGSSGASQGNYPTQAGPGQLILEW